MKFGLALPNFGGEITASANVRISQIAEELGFDSVLATDHVIMPKEKQGPYGYSIEPIVLLSFIASKTTRLKLGTSSMVLPQRNPILVAKQAAALDVVSNGRVILGFGAGWSEEEFAYLNADFHQRGRVFDESLTLMRKLWIDETIDFEGRFFNLKGAVFLPKPVQGSIPIWIAGNSDHALGRAARLGDGWHPAGLDAETLRKGIQTIRKMRSSSSGFTFTMRMALDVRKKRDDYPSSTRGERRFALSGSAADLRKGIGQFEDAGLDYLVASITRPREEEIIADLRVFSEGVIRSYS